MTNNEYDWNSSFKLAITILKYVPKIENIFFNKVNLPSDFSEVFLDCFGNMPWLKKIVIKKPKLSGLYMDLPKFYQVLKNQKIIFEISNIFDEKSVLEFEKYLDYVGEKDENIDSNFYSVILNNSCYDLKDCDDFKTPVIALF